VTQAPRWARTIIVLLKKTYSPPIIITCFLVASAMVPM
jgi:hypothetical protein